MSAFEEFVALELPQRAVMLTVANTSYTGNPNAATSDKIRFAPRGTWFINDATDDLYQKKDQAVSTSWSLLASGGSGSTSDIISANCLTTDAIQDAVCITADKTAGYYQVSKVDIDNGSATPSVGVIIEKQSSTVCTVQRTGIIYGLFSGLTPGATMFVGVSGNLIEGPPAHPTAGIRYVQAMGDALSSTEVALRINYPIGIRAAMP